MLISYKTAQMVDNTNNPNKSLTHAQFDSLLHRGSKEQRKLHLLEELRLFLL